MGDQIYKKRQNFTLLTHITSKFTATTDLGIFKIQIQFFEPHQYNYSIYDYAYK